LKGFQSSGSTQKVRDVAALVAVTAAFAGSLAMFRMAVGVASPWFGLTAMFCVLGVIAFARPLFLLRLPGFLRKARAGEARGALYEALRVPAFGALLRRTPLRGLNPMVYLSRNPDDPSAVLAQVESAEAAHLLAAAVLVPYVVHACVLRRWSAVAWLMAVQLGLNLYPILHLRWVRIRLGRLHQRELAHRFPHRSRNDT
jgi:hypothetical protein